MEHFKLTEIGSIPMDWEVVNIKDICKLINGRAYKKEELLQNGKYKVLRVGNFFSNNSWYFSNLELPSEQYVNNGDLMYAWSASFGPKFWNEEQTVYHYHIWKIKTFSNINKVFLFFLLEFDKQNILQETQGGTMFHITKISMERRKIPLPPTLEEQTAIATALSDADALIAALERLIAKKKDIKQGAMQTLLSPKDGWEVRKLGEIAIVRDGTHQTPKYVSHGIPFYSVENVTANNFENTKYITEKEHKFLTKNWRIEKGDILMTRIGSIGVCKYIEWDVNASFYVSLALLKINSEYSAEFIYHYSYFGYFRKEVQHNSLQFAYPQKINLGQISQIKVIIPKSKSEQTRIAQMLSDIDAEIAALESRLAKQRLIKQGMMEVLLTGKIRLL